MSAKCVHCNARAGDGATEVAYVHCLDGVVTGGREFLVCPRCAKRCSPKKIALKMRAAYKSATMN
jgi:hypothetical protein